MYTLMPPRARTATSKTTHSHRHTYRLKRQCGSPACTRCGYHRDAEQCFCGYVDPGVRRSKTPRLVFRA